MEILENKRDCYYYAVGVSNTIRMQFVAKLNADGANIGISSVIEEKCKIRLYTCGASKNFKKQVKDIYYKIKKEYNKCKNKYLYSFDVSIKKRTFLNNHIQSIYAGKHGQGSICLVAKNDKFNKIYISPKIDLQGRFLAVSGSNNYPVLIPKDDIISFSVKNVNCLPFIMFGDSGLFENAKDMCIIENITKTINPNYINYNNQK